jgi:hypothetical protein
MMFVMILIVVSLPIHDFTSFTSHHYHEETKETEKIRMKYSYKEQENLEMAFYVLIMKDGSEIKGNRRGADRRVWDYK